VDYSEREDALVAQWRTERPTRTYGEIGNALGRTADSVRWRWRTLRTQQPSMKVSLQQAPDLAFQVPARPVVL
jgi:hypothetical protein